jgi:hypothetical protein
VLQIPGAGIAFLREQILALLGTLPTQQWWNMPPRDSLGGLEFFFFFFKWKEIHCRRKENKPLIGHKARERKGGYRTQDTRRNYTEKVI